TPPRVEPEDEVTENVEEVPEPVQEDLPTDNTPANMLRAMEAAFNRMARRTDPEETRATAAQRQFKAMDPPTYKADGEPIEAEQWLTRVEKIFKAIRLRDDALRIETATFYLHGEAGEWWKTYEETNEEEEDLSWEDFKEVFLDEFFPDTLRERKREEFANLTQQNLTVEQYQRDFTKLSRYAPDMISSEKRKIRKFESGLRPSIYIPVVSSLHQTYKDCVNVALRVEAGIIKRQQQDRFRPQNKRRQNQNRAFGNAPTEQKEGGQQGPRNNNQKRPRDFYPQPSQNQVLPAP
ncbi:retrotransposon gag domain-containing protein, partial [Klebsiella pneumoniae]|uniref:retrotransposon gag family protein n=1 Tax=Klebsiella pneumoniae TaxID=573 RepID=UPI001939C110